MEVLICESNEEDAKKLEDFIRDMAGDVKIYKCYSIKDALYLTMIRDIDLYIINDSPGVDDRYETIGLKFIQYLRGHNRTKFIPIIVTSKLYDEYNLIIKELSCNAYIKKPLDLKSNENKIEYSIRLAEHIYERRKYSLGIIFVKDKDTIRVINEKEVLWVEKHTHDIVFHKNNGEIITDRRAADNVIKKLDKDRFLSVGRCDIINIEHVERINGNIVMFDQEKLSIHVGKEAACKLRSFLREKKRIS